MSLARRWLLVTAHFLCPLLFFTNLTRNPYVTQIALLNAALALALAAWAWQEASRPGGARLPRLPIEWPLALLVVVWSASWLRAYFAHAEFFRPAIIAEGARGGLFLLVNVLAAFWLSATIAAEDETGEEVALAPWAAFVLVWGALWTVFPQARVRGGGRAEDIFAMLWDPYGALLWAGGLGAAAWLARRARAVDFLHLAFAASFLASAYGLAQYFNYEFVWPHVLNPYGGRAVSTFGNPNFLSSYNAALMPSALAFFLLEKRDGRRWVYGLLFLIQQAALLATLTRSSWGGAAVGVAALFLSPQVRSRVKEGPRAVGLLFGVGLALALAWPSSTMSSGYKPTFIGRLTEFKEIAGAAGFYSPWHQRLLIWTCAWMMGSEAPLLGKGGGLFELFYPFYQGHMLHEERFYHTMRTHANNAHNEVLETFAQTGLLGLGVFVWLWAAFFAVSGRWARGRSGADPIWIGAVAGTAAVLADNLLNVSLHFAVPAFIFWWLAGTAMGRGARGAGERVWTAGAGRRAAGAALAAVALLAAWMHVRTWWREAWYFAGFKLVRQGNLPAAAQALNRSRQWGPREVNAIYELGNVYARSGQSREAAEAYEGALKANAGYDEIYFNLATVYASQLGAPDKARAYYETAWAINPLSNETLNGLTGLYMRDPPRHKAAALRLLWEAVRVSPDNPNNWNNLAYLLTLEGRWPEAQRAYVRALELSPESALVERSLAAVSARVGGPRPAVLEDLAELRAVSEAAGRGDWSPAVLRRVERLVERRPRLLMARFLRGSLLLANGRAAEAAAELERVVAADAGRASARVNLGNAYLALSRPAEAEAQFRAALSLEPGNAAARARLQAMGKAP